jgi:hypothetical protein
MHMTAVDIERRANGLAMSCVKRRQVRPSEMSDMPPLTPVGIPHEHDTMVTAKPAAVHRNRSVGTREFTRITGA